MWFQNRRAKFRKQERAANAKGGGNTGNASVTAKKPGEARASSEDDESKESTCSPTPDSTASLPSSANTTGSPGASSLSPSSSSGGFGNASSSPSVHHALKSPAWSGVGSAAPAPAPDLLKSWQPGDSASAGPFAGVLSSFHRKPGALKTNLF